MEQISEELTVPFMDAVVADDAMTGSVQVRDLPRIKWVKIRHDWLGAGTRPAAD